VDNTLAFLVCCSKQLTSLVPWIKNVDLKPLVRVQFSSIEGEELIKLRGLSSLPVALVRNNATVIPASSHRANTIVGNYCLLNYRFLSNPRSGYKSFTPTPFGLLAILAGKQLSQPRATLDFKQTRIGTIDDRAVLCAFGFFKSLPILACC
jgi:hypothetical protein